MCTCRLVVRYTGLYIRFLSGDLECIYIYQHIFQSLDIRRPELDFVLGEQYLMSWTEGVVLVERRNGAFQIVVEWRYRNDPDSRHRSTFYSESRVIFFQLRVFFLLRLYQRY